MLIDLLKGKFDYIINQINKTNNKLLAVAVVNNKCSIANNEIGNCKWLIALWHEIILKLDYNLLFKGIACVNSTLHWIIT